jgi:electron transfer flavoprotein beta subunit
LRFSIAPDRKALDPSGLKYEMSDFDGYALEVALRLVEAAGTGEVVLVTVGPDGAQETLRKGLAMGAARAIQLKADDVPVDGFAVASALAAELKGGGYDLILFGRQATDTAAGTVGPMVAELIDLPCVTAVSQLDIAGGRGTARRDLEGAAETVEFPLPAVVTIDEGIARALAAELEGGGYDLILFGRMATDPASGTVGPMVAELLGLPCVTAISNLEIAGGQGTARRDLEGAAETVRFPLPAVLTIDEGIARPRLATLKGIMAAKKKPLETRPAALGEVRLTVESMALPPERSGPRFVGEGSDAVPELVQRLRTEAKVL